MLKTYECSECKNKFEIEVDNEVDKLISINEYICDGCYDKLADTIQCNSCPEYYRCRNNLNL